MYLFYLKVTKSYVQFLFKSINEYAAYTKIYILLNYILNEENQCRAFSVQNRKINDDTDTKTARNVTVNELNCTKSNIREIFSLKLSGD